MKKDRIVKLEENYIGLSVLGLDISSSTIGWGLVSLTNPPILLSYGHIKPLDSKYSEIERLNNVYVRINNLCNLLKPSVVSVEDVFLFMKGKSTARTITLLTAFNRVVSLSAFQNMKSVVFYNVHDIRKSIKTIYNTENISKEDMPNIIVENLSPKFKGDINKKGLQIKETYDEADGIAAALCYVLYYYNPNLKKGKK